MRIKYLILASSGKNPNGNDSGLDNDDDVEFPWVRDDHGLHGVPIPGEAGLPQLPCVLSQVIVKPWPGPKPLAPKLKNQKPKTKNQGALGLH